VVLDRQLQNTIYQFDHRQGVVQKIDEDSRQLAEALESGVPIIITTLQKFPFVSGQLMKLAEERGEGSSHLPTRNYAVIIDEAHSSQSGETATELKGVLGGAELIRKAREAAQEEGEAELERLFRAMAKRGRQPNMSFFAFTATPKHKTLAIFGRGGEPFHRYTMRQAIEEGFIEDVLKSYVSYKTYYKLIKKAEDDPNVERKKAARALARFMRLPATRSAATPRRWWSPVRGWRRCATSRSSIATSAKRATPSRAWWPFPARWKTTRCPRRPTPKSR
jgi:type I restriction enzyme R subunit